MRTSRAVAAGRRSRVFAICLGEYPAARSSRTRSGTCVWTATPIAYPADVPAGGPEHAVRRRSAAQRRRAVVRDSRHPGPAIGRGTTDLTGTGRGVALPPVSLCPSAARRATAGCRASPTRSTRDRVDGYHGVRALGSLKTKPAAGSPAARPEPAIHLERAEQGVLAARRPVSGGHAALGLPPRPGHAAHTGGQPAALAPARARPTLQLPPRGLRAPASPTPSPQRCAAREGVVTRPAASCCAAAAT
jgi:hypothetical protein